MWDKFCGAKRENRENKKPDSVESGLAVVRGGFLFFSRGAHVSRQTIVAKPTRASVRV
jgi:hypothetical protein